MRTTALLLLALLAACAGPSNGLVAHVTSSGVGDARTDGDVVVVVGDVSAALGVRTLSGLPIFLVPPMPLDRAEWYVRSGERGYERRAPLAEPLPHWVRPLYLDAELERLQGLGIFLAFDPPPPLDPEQ